MRQVRNRFHHLAGYGLRILLAALLIVLTPPAAQSAPPADRLVYLKSRLGLMPPAYGPTAEEILALRQESLITGSLFDPFVAYSSGSWPEAVTAARYTGDGRTDVVLSTSFAWDPTNDNRVHLFAQTPSGTLTRTARLAAGNNPMAIANGDLNRDGRMDVATANQDASTVGVFLQQPSGGLAAMVAYNAGAGPDSVAVGDFNGDLRDDLAVSHAIDQRVAIHYQQADGTLAAPVLLGVSSAGYNELATGDLNGDGYDDLVMLRGAGHNSFQVAVFYQQNRQLTAPIFRTAQDGGFLAHGLAVGDVTGDGRDDIVVTAGGNAPQAYLNVFTQLSDGTLATAPTVYAAYHLPQAVEIGDVNHDGRNDVVTNHAAWLALSVYTQTLGSTLGPYERYSLPYSDFYRPMGLVLSDVTHDGALDVLVASHSSLPAENGLVVLANTGDAPTSTITVPALGTYITNTAIYQVQGQASTANGTLALSFDGGHTWITRTSALNWIHDWTVPLTDGAHIILSRVTDAAGQVQSPPARTRAIVDRTLPLGSVIINNGAIYTNQPTVTLGVTGSDFNDVDRMRFANQGGGYSGWIPFTTTYAPWLLSGPDGVKTVTGQVRDMPGNASNPFSDTIILDTTPPSCQIVINADAPYVNSTQVTLTLASTDTNGVTTMRVRNASGAWTDWAPYTTTLDWNIGGGDGPHAVAAQFHDIAGNDSAVCSDTIILDTTAPTCEISIADGATYTVQPTVTLGLTSADLNGVARLRLRDQGQGWIPWETYTATRSWVLPSPDGLKAVEAQFEDVAGNLSAVCGDSIILDTILPVGSIVIAGGALYTPVPTVTLGLTASDTNGVAGMRFSNDGIGWATWQAYATSTTWVLTPGDGSKMVYAQYQDTPGNVGGPFTDTIILDTTPPLGTVVINNGATYTRFTVVTLTLSAADVYGVTEMRIRNAAGVWTSWQTYTTTLSWNLGSGDGTRTVEAQFRDVVGNESAVCSDTIILDTVPPSCGIVIAGGAPYTTQPTVTLTLTSSDLNGVARLRLRNAGQPWPPDWEPYATTHSWVLPLPDGSKTVEAQFEDSAGNTSAICGDSIILDTTPPIGWVLINGGALYTGVPTVTLTLGASDLNGVAQMRFSNDGTTWSPWLPYAAGATWVLSSGDGVKTVYVQYQDTPGNVGGPFTDTIILDTTPPGGEIIVNDGALHTRILTVTLSITPTDQIPVTDMRFSNDGSSWTAWEAYAPTRTWILAPGDGLKTVYVEFRDAVGNVSDPLADGIIYDTTAPTCQVLINLTAPYVTETAVLLYVSCDDANPPIQVRYSNDNDTWTPWEPYSAIKDWTLSGGDGLKTVYMQAQDTPGNEGGPFTDTIILDTTPPVCAVMINDGAPSTTSPDVMLNILCTDVNGLDMIQLSDDGVIWGTWRPYATALPWTLPAGDGPKTVYLQGRDNPGNVAGPVSDTITLDTTDPWCSIIVNGDQPYATSPQVTLTLNCTDTNGLGAIRLSNDGLSWEPWISYTTSLSWTLPGGDGLKTVYLQGRDIPGNAADPVNDSIILDTTAPACPFFINLTAPYVTETAVLLYVSCDDANPPIQVRYSNDCSNWTPWEPYSAIKDWALSDGDGLKTVCLEAQDTPGNIGGPFTDTIVLDTLPPSCTITINGDDPYVTETSVLLNIECFDINGVDQIRLSDDGVNWGAWQAPVPTLTWTLPWGDGAKTVYLQARDVPQNISEPVSDTIILDTTLPSGGCSIPDDNGYVNNPNVVVASWAYDDNGVPKMWLRDAGEPGTGWITFTTPFPWTLPGGDGEKVVECKFKDTPGNVSPVYSCSIILDQQPPTCYIAANGGATYTNDLAVTLILSSTDNYGVHDMGFSNDCVNWSPWEPFGTSRGWNLLSGDGEKTVCVRFRDLANNVQQCSDDIILDTTPPTGTIVLAGGADYTASPTVTVTLAATDTLSGVDQVCVAAAGAPCTDWQPYTTTLTWTLALTDGIPQEVCACFEDHATNPSGPTCDSIVLDTGTPTGSVVINDDAEYATQTLALLDLWAGDTTSGVDTMYLSADGTQWSTYSYTTTITWTLPGPDGRQTAYAQFQDGANNRSPIYSDTIVLDREPPSGSIVVAEGATFVSHTLVPLTLAADDATSGVANMHLYNCGDIGSWPPFTSTVSWELLPGDGVKAVCVEYQDAVGLSSPTYSDTVVLDTVPPTGSVVINGGASHTGQLTVTLALEAQDLTSGVCSFQVRDSGGPWSEWMAYTTTLQWILDPSGGEHTMEVRFRDCAGNIGPAADDSIVLEYYLYLPVVTRNSVTP